MDKQHIKVIVACCMIMGAMIAGVLSFSFFMDPVTTELGLERGAFSLYITALCVVGTITLPVYGRVIEKAGERRVTLFAGAWTGICIAALSICDSLPMFYVVAALAGLGFYGSTYAVVPVVVNNWFAQKGGFVMGVASGAGGVISIVMSLVFPMLIQQLGWRIGYVLDGAIFLTLTVAAALFLLCSKPEEALSMVRGQGDGDAQIAKDAQKNLPGIPYKKALAMPQFWLINVALLAFSASITVTQHLIAFFVSVGFSSVTGGMFMSVAAVGVVLTSFVTGFVVEKAGLSKTMVGATILYVIAFILLSMAPSVLVICVVMLLLAIGNCYTSLFAPLIVFNAFGLCDYAGLWGIVSMVSTLGQAAGAPLWGLSYDITGGYQVGMWIAAVAVVIALVVLLGAMKSAARGQG